MAYGRRYSEDPRWIRAKFGNCARCEQPLKGKRAAYFPNGRTVFCEKCGQTEMAAFDAAAFDEAVMTGTIGNW